MNEIVSTSSSGLLPVAPRVSITTRLATSADLPFLDGLQKQHSKALGFFPRAQMEGYVLNGWVLIAEDATTRTPLGYCASRDRYLKRDELGVIYQLCVAPRHQRGLIGASLIKAVFERSAYGCRLYCCWCAQDLEANYFWESLGFVPIAFRGGSGKKKRVHLFWQRRIREGDMGEKATPWWFPSKTDQGAMREDRLVLPIPPGLHWSDPMPVLRPVEEPVPSAAEGPGSTELAVGTPRRATRAGRAARVAPAAPVKQPRVMRGIVAPGAAESIAAPPTGPQTDAIKPKPAKAPRAKARIDPQLIARARELRDRYLERLNESPDALPAPAARYDVSRSLPAMRAVESAAPDAPRALPNAA